MKKIFTLIVACVATMSAFAADLKFVGPSDFYVQGQKETTTVTTVKDTVKLNNFNLKTETGDLVIPEMKYTVPGSTSVMTLASFTIKNPTMKYANYVASFPEQDYATTTVDASGATKNVDGKVSGTYSATTGVLTLYVTINYGAMKSMGMTIVYECTAYYTKENDWGLPGVGNTANPFRILEAADFTSMANKISETNTGSGKYFQMMNDVDFGGTETSPAILPCIGVGGLCGTNEKTGAALGRIPNAFVWGFQGSFDGNGKSIKGIWQNTSTGCDALFTTLGEGGVVKNLTFDAENSITTTGSYCAPFVAVNYAGTVDNCVNNAAVTGKIYTSGICNFLVKGKGTVQNCTNNGAITSTTSYAAGIVAGTQSGATIGSTDADYAGNLVDNCTNNGVCTSKGVGAGGIAGSFSGKITNCTNNAEVTAAGNYAGGIVGCQSYVSGVSGNTNKGAITGKNYVAGIMGYLMKGGNEAFDISDNTNEGTYTATTGADTGAILGGSARDQKDPKPTAINNVNADVNANAVADTYKAMVGGKFVIVKGGKQYNAAGAQMK